MTSLTLNGHAIYLEAAGPETGKPVILLHHGLGSTESWRGTLPALAAAGYRAIAYDRWGYGRSDFRRGIDIPRFEADLTDLDCLIAALGEPQVALVGHSDGGTIALRYAAQRQERVSALVAVAAHVYVENKMDPGIQGVRQAFEAEPRFREGLRRLHGDKVEAVFSNWFDGWLREENLSWDLRAELGTITCPTLVAQGVEDEHAAPRHAEDITAAVPGAQLWLAEGAAHMLPQEQPDLFNRRLIEFLQEAGWG